MLSHSARIMSRVLAVVGIGFFTMGSQVSCSSGDGGLQGRIDDDSTTGATFSTSLVLRNSNGTQSRDFLRGETITFELSVRNRTSSSVEVDFSSTRIFDFLVIDDGSTNIRWRYSDDRAYAQVLTSVIFAPGETKTYIVSWDQILSGGSQLPTGSYDARGLLTEIEFGSNPFATHEMASPLYEFTVR